MPLLESPAELFEKIEDEIDFVVRDGLAFCTRSLQNRDALAVRLPLDF